MAGTATQANAPVGGRRGGPLRGGGERIRAGTHEVVCVCVACGGVCDCEWCRQECLLGEGMGSWPRPVVGRKGGAVEAVGGLQTTEPRASASGFRGATDRASGGLTAAVLHHCMLPDGACVQPA